MPNLLFEIGCEELPSLYIRPALDFIKTEFITSVIKNKIKYSNIIVDGTPRRLVLIVYKLEYCEKKDYSENKVYKKRVLSDDIIKDKLMQKLEEVLIIILEHIIINIPFKKKMYWEKSKALFARPVRWILCLLDGKVVNISFAGIKANNITYGHKFLSFGFTKINNIRYYFDYLKNHYVMLSSKERQNLILCKSNMLINQYQGILINKIELIENLSYMVEYPWIFLAKFDKIFLKIPKEILINTIVESKKYVAILDVNLNILPYFIIITNIQPEVENHFSNEHSKMLSSKFKDIEFYYKQDLKYKLEFFSKSLKNVLFQKSLGSISDKISRINLLTKFVCSEICFSELVNKNIKRAVFLCKCDLASNVVIHFPKLKGIIGRIYAYKDGENKEVSTAIEQHYWPKYSEHILPQSDEASVIALSDKIDTFVGLSLLNNLPKGTSDPFSVRRIAASISRIILDRQYKLSIKKLLRKSLMFYSKHYKIVNVNLLNQMFNFIYARLRSVLVKSVLLTIKYDKKVMFIDSVMSIYSDNFIDIYSRLNALLIFNKNNSKDFHYLCVNIKRVFNILKKFDCICTNVNFCYLIDPLEIQLLAKINVIEKLFSVTCSLSTQKLTDHYIIILTNCINLATYIEKFFNNVKIIHSNINIKNARLLLLIKIKKLILSIADFTKIIIK